MEDLKKLGFFETGDNKLTEDQKKELLEKKQKDMEALEAISNPTPGKEGYSCKKAKAKIAETGLEVEVRPPCSEGYCCGTAWSKDVEEEASLADDFKDSVDPLK